MRFDITQRASFGPTTEDEEANRGTDAGLRNAPVFPVGGATTFSGRSRAYKLIAGELRILVCAFRHNKPLLLDMMDHFGFSYEIQPPGPPFDKQPIPLVGWRDDPVAQEISRILEGSDPDKITIAMARQGPPGRTTKTITPATLCR
jgi:hypothetical protein